MCFTWGPKTIKICLASTWRAIRGISTYNMYLVEELRKINPDLFILAEYRAVGGSDNGTIYPNVPYKECWNRNTGFGNVLDVIKEQSPDVIHWSHEFGLFCLNQSTTIQYLALLEAINKLGIKQTIVYHSVPQIPNAFFQHYFDKSSPFFDKIVAHTNEQMSFLMSYKVPQDKLIHINHGTKLSQSTHDFHITYQFYIKINKHINISSHLNILF